MIIRAKWATTSKANVTPVTAMYSRISAFPSVVILKLAGGTHLAETHVALLCPARSPVAKTTFVELLKAISRRLLSITGGVICQAR